MRSYYDGVEGDQRDPHDSGRPVDLATLSELGVIAREQLQEDAVNALAKERGYKCRDQITISKEAMGDIYESKLKTFFEEHLHEDEEIRWINEGSGYFDVRDQSLPEKWIRIALEANDLVVLPAGIYHRFTLDNKNYTKATRLFQQPKWTPLPRSTGTTDANEHRRSYLTSLKNLQGEPISA